MTINLNLKKIKDFKQEAKSKHFFPEGSDQRAKYLVFSTSIEFCPESGIKHEDVTIVYYGTFKGYATE